MEDSTKALFIEIPPDVQNKLHKIKMLGRTSIKDYVISLLEKDFKRLNL